MLHADFALAHRLESAEMAGVIGYAETHARLFPDSGACAERIAGGAAVYAGADSPVTQVVGLGMNGPVTSDEFDLVEAFFRGYAAPVSIELCPLSDDSVRRIAAERGYRLAGYTNVLARELTASAARPTREAAKVRQTGPEDEENWVVTVARGFAGDEVPVHALRIPRTNFHMNGSICFLAERRGTPTGGGMLNVHGSVAVFGSTSVVQRYRNTGIHRALLRARLAHAAALGCDLAMVRTLPGTRSQANVERAGFRVMYTRLRLSRDVGSFH